jgi:micrococcal nuclease
VHVNVLVLVRLLGGSAGCGVASDTAVVDRVIDGDTIVTTTGEKVRYLLIDAPETTDGHDDCFGSNATQLNSDLVLGKTITLTYDVTRTDAYGRTLAYVSVDALDINARLLERGAACVLFIPPDGTERRAAYEALQSDARSHQRGIWGTCHPLPPAC